MPRGTRTLALATAALATAATLALSGCEVRIGDGTDGAGFGERQTVTFDLDPVTTVSLGTSGTMRVVVGDTPSLTVTAREDVLAELTAVTHGTTLDIDLRGTWVNLGPIEYELVTPDLDTVEIRGSADVLGEMSPAGGTAALIVRGSGTARLDGVAADEVTVHIDGSGSADLTALDATSVELVVQGSGTVTATGTATRLDASISGSGDVDTGDLEAVAAVVSVHGSGSARVLATGTLTAEIAGSGSIRHLGDPQVTRSISGSGHVGPA